VRIPEDVRAALAARLARHAARRWKGRCRGVFVTFRGAFAYVDAYPAEEDDPTLTKEEKARLDATPTHLCRLEYAGRRDLWGFAFYMYSDSRYERNVLPNGSWAGTPEECFDCAAMVYLQRR